jgi:hypothetical protein
MDNRITFIMIAAILGASLGFGVASIEHQLNRSQYELLLSEQESQLTDSHLQLTALNSSLIEMQSRLSGWKEEGNVVASDSWFFICIAPYQEMTHECYYHASSCQGELRSVAVNYTVNAVEGTFSSQGISATKANGFMDLYLPLNMRYHITVIVNGLKGNVTVTTFPDSPTCVTNLKVV